MKRKRNAVVILICVVSLMTGCFSPQVKENDEKQKKHLKIGISVYDQYDTFISSVTEAFREAVKQKEKETGMTITVEVVGAGGKQSLQNDQVTEFIDQGCDIICVNLVDRTDATLVIERAKNADVPVIFFNRELVQEDLERWEKLYYVGAVALESGIMEGQIVADLCSGEAGINALDKNADGKLQYVILEGEPGHQDATVRTEYSIKTITEAGVPLEKLGNEIANWSRAQAQTKMNLWLAEFGDEIELVICNNDDMALGAIDAYKESGRTERPVIVGIDGTIPALEAVKNGYLDGTVKNDGAGQAASMLELAYALHTGEKLKLANGIEMSDNIYIRLPHKIVTPENVDEFID